MSISHSTTSRLGSALRWLGIVGGLFTADLLLSRGGFRTLADLCFWSAIVISILLFFHSQEPRLRRFLSVPIDARFLPATRVIYALLCIYTTGQHGWAVEYGMEPSNFPLLGIPQNKALAYALYAVYMVALLALLFGKRIRASWIIVFVVGGIIIPHSLELFIKQPLNFFSIFISPALWRGDRRAETPSSGWPMLMAGLCIAFITAGAGVFKLFDPVWQHGTGFYYSLNMPFFCPKHLRPLLDSWPLMLFGNWATIVVEIIALPLFLFRRTRALALFCIVGLGVFLSWPMWGIGIVGGPIVLAYVPAWMGICPPLARWWLTLRKKSMAHTLPVVLPSGDPRLPGYAIMLAWWSVLGVFSLSLSKYDRFKYSPPLYGYTQFEVTRPPVIALPSHMDQRIHDTYEGLNMLRPHRLWEWVWLLELFDYHHLFERAAYQVRVEDPTGAEHLVGLFDEDRALNMDVALFGYIHFLKPVDAIRALRHRDRAKPDRLMYYSAVMDEIARYAIAQLPPGSTARAVTIDVHPLHQPLKFQGDSKPWLTRTRYEPFYQYDPATRSGKVIGSVAPFPFDQLDVPAFRDKVIVPVPDAPVVVAP